jgi:hypothetical protein
MVRGHRMSVPICHSGLPGTSSVYDKVTSAMTAPNEHSTLSKTVNPPSEDHNMISMSQPPSTSPRDANRYSLA